MMGREKDVFAWAGWGSSIGTVRLAENEQIKIVRS